MSEGERADTIGTIYGNAIPHRDFGHAPLEFSSLGTGLTESRAENRRSLNTLPAKAFQRRRHQWRCNGDYSELYALGQIVH
jgi:hypothetical protein